ncbi:putative harbinger transposase-derived protein [Helianthus annuus]|nr:putative harbinger transposase-derived protein [Helianthus annuus]KAJ0573649.1 putative harbinger transposase-derived protein [Helianthus annuus]KAJ0738006.1 putative harbinger transposase-derived protein [Helianthus annuus]KAJ0911981.1 putative harbinger transposase-derived protein [Helianthus annuus]
MKDYFDEAPTFSNPEIFRRRFRMSKRLFLRIVDDLEANYDYFKQKADARGTLGFTGIQKCTSALRVLAYGNTTDINDEYLKMAEKTTRDTLEHFCRGIIDLYGARYLRTPTWDDLQKIYEVHSAEHGLPGMIGSLDCMHWRWDNCPTAWRGQHTRGDQKGPTVILQAVASQDLWVWSAYFGVVGSCNDINVFEQSPLLEDWISGRAPKASFYANGNYYPHGYYLCDGIYPRYSIVVKTFSDPIDEKRAYFKKVQESSRKDIERCFGVLKQR